MTTLSPNMKSNLAALIHVQKDVVERLCQPSNDDHIQGTPPRLIVNRSQYPIVLNAEQLKASAGGGLTGTVLVIGVGTGELVMAALELNPDARIVAWDRDPAMMRLSLAGHDFSGPIGEGRLVFSLSEDIFDFQDHSPDRVLLHPLLGQIYAHEHRLLDLDSAAPRVLMCAGGLFVDDVAECLEAAGMSVYIWDVRRLSEEHLRSSAERIRPDFAFAINYVDGMAEACSEMGIPLIVWEIDPATDGLRPVGCNTEHVRIHTYRAANVQRFEAAGFRHVSYTPLAANTSKRTPGSGGPRKGPEVCFVGASMVDQAMLFRDTFLNAWADVHSKNASAFQQGEQLLQGLLAQQRSRPREYVVPLLMRRHMADFVAVAEQRLAHDPVALVAEIAAAERRLNVAARLGDEGLHVWGDPGWKKAEPHGVKYRGFAGHRRALTEIYRDGHIHVDINRLYQLDIVPMRVFDILACGGFLIAEYSPALERLFDIGTEVESWQSVDELLEKVRYYKDHPEEALYIAEKGYRAVCDRHTIAGRVLGMLRDLPQFTGVSAVG